MRRALALTLCLGATGAAAQDLPAFFDVTGVAADDVLNVREAPDAGAPVIGSLPHDARDVAVVARGPKGEWGLVNLHERAGWASLHYLAAQPPREDAPLPVQCSGTEPFWSLGLTEGEASFDMAGETATTWQAPQVVASANRTDIWALFAKDGPARLTAFLSRRRCSDGMSGRAYGLTLDLIVKDDGRRALSGCCTLR